MWSSFQSTTDMLAGIVLARLGADVVLTDLAPNLPLLAGNCKANGVSYMNTKNRLQHAHTHNACTSMILPMHLCIKMLKIRKSSQDSSGAWLWLLDGSLISQHFGHCSN